MGRGGTKILPLAGCFILVGYRLTPHMREEQKGAWTWPGGSPKEKGGWDKERQRKGGGAGPGSAPHREVCFTRGEESLHPACVIKAPPFAINPASVAVAKGRKVSPEKSSGETLPVFCFCFCPEILADSTRCPTPTADSAPLAPSSL